MSLFFSFIIFTHTIMNKHNSKAFSHFGKNLIGNLTHRRFISILAEYGFAQRGGFFLEDFPAHSQRLADNVNLLRPLERKEIIYSEPISKN
jgi:hypothetical protein